MKTTSVLFSHEKKERLSTISEKHYLKT